jgi:hypothetical protein
MDMKTAKKAMDMKTAKKAMDMKTAKKAMDMKTITTTTIAITTMDMQQLPTKYFF